MADTAATDLAIVGAGIAGLAAAKTARAAGLDVRVLEAGARIGGRALTDTDRCGQPWDRGCHWLHAADTNPFRQLADDLGEPYNTGAAPRHIHLGRRWASADEVADLNAVTGRANAAIERHGEAGRDLPASWVLPEGSPWVPLYRQWLAAVAGAEPAATSTLDAARYADSPANWPVRNGFGRLVAHWGADVPVALTTPVHEIDRRGPTVSLRTPHGTVRARRAIVTASTSALAHGAVRFTPELPAWMAEALAAAPLGGAEKVMLAFDRDIFGLGHSFASSLRRAPYGFEIQITPFGRPVAIAHCGGHLATEMAALGPNALVERARACLRDLAGPAVDRHLVDWSVTGWTRDPAFRGGYSVALPGRAREREALSTPVDERIWFAGEACDLAAYGTANAARASGERAARAAVESLTGGVRAAR